MGHHLSKQTVVVVASSKKTATNQKKSRSKQSRRADLEFDLEQSQSQLPDQELEHRLEQLPATINLQIAEAGEAAAGGIATVASAVGGEEASSEVRQIIIKIQLAKMENGNESTEQGQQQHQSNTDGATTSADALNANQEQIVNVTVGAVGEATPGAAGAIRTAGSSTEAPKTNERQLVNNNNLAGNVASASASAAVKSQHDGGAADDDVVDEDDESEMAMASLLRRRRASSVEGVEYSEVFEPQPVKEMLSTGAQRALAPNSCSCSRSSKTMSVGAALPAAVPGRRWCCKCKCRDAWRSLRSILESGTGNNISNGSSSSNTTNNHSSRDKKETTTSGARGKRRSSADRRSTPPTLSGASGSRLHAQRQRNSVAVAEPSQLAIWATPANANGDVIIRISSQQKPQFVVEPAVGGAAACICSGGSAANGTPVVTMGPNIRLVASTEPSGATGHVLPLALEQPRPAAPNAYGAGVTVHSQIDFMHCLVPDLEQIVNSSFYWGKMDRYEAERLLEGKPEGTFLLRDSAQEEFLFSVTFRKYGRSLHARIEQSGHKFSFDCHDPSVFAALTVTGLVEHYKDPSCVMFFEPCLTIPLHRRQTFSLEQLARATIVSNTTYDGINQLELPESLKSYLKKYHYKQKLRVKSCDAHTPAPYYANI